MVVLSVVVAKRKENPGNCFNLLRCRKTLVAYKYIQALNQNNRYIFFKRRCTRKRTFIANFWKKSFLFRGAKEKEYHHSIDLFKSRNMLEKKAWKNTTLVSQASFVRFVPSGLSFPLLWLFFCKKSTWTGSGTFSTFSFFCIFLLSVA